MPLALVVMRLPGALRAGFAAAFAGIGLVMGLAFFQGVLT
jgi:hypothetical protein